MQDMFFAVAMMFTVGYAMRKHNPNFVIGKGLGDFIAWFIASLFLLAMVRLPIYLVWCGPRFPFDPNGTQQFVSGAVAIAFWWAMIWWRVPAATIEYFRRKK